ncbi:hypothetical protein FH972_005528 [Carpinus fangiana]|uniref:Uncharacterized protein n=1 Tax=Carpinus fangiana TaxID=176857 RepID=A0A5N6QT08_9ROSI|nr:hypothetical protein FH972_005528 [Carpinus fangiana]
MHVQRGCHERHPRPLHGARGTLREAAQRAQRFHRSDRPRHSGFFTQSCLLEVAHQRPVLQTPHSRFHGDEREGLRSRGFRWSTVANPCWWEKHKT